MRAERAAALSASPLRSVKIVLVVVGALWLIALMGRIGMADRWAEADPAAALDWWPGHVEAAQARLDQFEPTQGDDTSMTQLAQALLTRAPLSGAAYRALARQAEARGDLDRATGLFKSASEREPRDRAAHAWLFERYSALGQLDRALDHLDQLFRLSPQRSEAWMQALAQYAEHPAARPILVRWLGEHAPPWRARFLAWWVRRPESEPLLAEVLSPLRHAAEPLDASERSTWIERLLQLNRGQEAYYLWIDGLDPAGSISIGNVYDGGFESDGKRGSFDWRLGRIAGAWISLEHTPGVVGERALRIEFQHRRVPFAHVQQRLALTPGEYTLSGRVQLDRIDTQRGLVWDVTCEGRVVAGSTPHLRGQHAWRAFEADLRIPAEGCEWQWLRLRLDARTRSEQWIGGVAWFDDLRVQHTSTTEPPRSR